LNIILDSYLLQHFNLDICSCSVPNRIATHQWPSCIIVYFDAIVIIMFTLLSLPLLIKTYSVKVQCLTMDSKNSQSGKLYNILCFNETKYYLMYYKHQPCYDLLLVVQWT